MKFVVDRDIVSALLTKAQSTVSNKEAQQILKNFLIKVEPNKLRVMSTDMALGSVVEVALPSVEEEGSTCAPAKRLLEMVTTAPAGNMLFHLEANVLTIRTAYVTKNEKGPLPEPKFKNEWLLHCMDAALYPEFPDFDAKQAVVCPREGFVGGMGRISFAAAETEIKVNLMGLYVNNGFMYTADGHRACRLRYESPLKDVMIPAPAVSMLVPLLKASQVQAVEVMKTKFHLLFKVGADLYHTRLLEAEFPDVEGRVFKDTEAYGFKLKLRREELGGAIKRAKITSSEDNNVLTLKYKDGALTLQTRNNIDDACRETLEFVEWNGEPEWERDINWEYLLDVVSALKEDAVVLRLGEDKGLVKSKFRIDEGSAVHPNGTPIAELSAVILPLRIKRDAEGKIINEQVHERVKKRAEAATAKKEMEGLVSGN